jgi:hypothetical protein
MAILTITVTITCFLFWIIGIHTETKRVVMAMVTAIVIYLAWGLTTPAVTSVLMRTGLARDAQGELIKDGRGKLVYSQEYVRSYRGTQEALISMLYFSGSILIAGAILLVYRFLAGGLAADRNMRGRREDDESSDTRPPSRK